MERSAINKNVLSINRQTLAVIANSVRIRKQSRRFGRQGDALKKAKEQKQRDKSDFGNWVFHFIAVTERVIVMENGGTFKQ